MNAKQVIDFYGTQMKAAEALGIKQPSISEWLSSGDIPMVRQYQIELATNGQLRADIPALRVQAA